MRLLTMGRTNPKLAKSDAKGEYLTCGLSLAPSVTSGYNVCVSASPACRAQCLFFAGRGRMQKVQQARIAKTKLWYEDRITFKRQLIVELAAFVAKCEKYNKKPACRLNILSDIVWERIFPDIFTLFPMVQFYDYTKHSQRIYSKLPSNYHLTFSRSEINEDTALFILNNKIANVAVVFHEIPETWNGFPVKYGDEDDLRFLDPSPGYVIGLKAKGRAKHDTQGFVV